jgi:uncharacterized repeat protein (TIGR04076 family)
LKGLYSRIPIREYVVIARVESVHGLEGEDTHHLGPCPYYRQGDEIVFDRSTIRGTICYSALASMMYKILPMRYGLDYPWMEKGVLTHACPDAARPVIFEIRRKRKQDKKKS